MSQFLLEAMALSLTGGLLGVGAGLVVVTVAHAGIATVQENWVPVWSVGGVGAALGSTAAIGLFFGAVPAWRASRLDIVECLRR